MRRIGFNYLLFLALVIATFSLVFAYVMQYVFDVLPCILCLYQRVPYFLVVALSIFGLFGGENAKKAVFYLIVLAFFANGAIAFFHVGVENGFFELTKKCVSGFEATTIDQLKKEIFGASLARCDEVKMRILGLSMASWNFILCLFLVAFSLFRRKYILNSIEEKRG